ncbi:rogdi leucine zipper containing protein domain-containing protein [Ditylenchus destructor]|uniref:Rogdi leucine zipper containing protein domain-containing protein n=1 Tax=Ditylenchus destructor TaxID=166010 RepID=A0AAD4RBN6_9BILA|nr:rogdi leucine zipper containing protein domain-containing protein [Ditylenchus destructor]
MPTEEEKEAFWLQQIRVKSVLLNLENTLREIVKRLHASNKIDGPSESTKSNKEKYSLLPRSGQDNLNVTVTLQDENVIQTDVNLKYAKSAVGYYRATANPDIQWKLTQIQDASNQCVRALEILLKGMKKYETAMASENASRANVETLILTILNSVKENVKQARSSLTLPKRKSLVELCQFQPIKSFNPPLPHDILLSYYIASAKLVCAAYQVVPKSNGVQTVTIYQAECRLPQIVEVVHYLNTAFSIAHDFLANYCMLKKPSINAA